MTNEQWLPIPGFEGFYSVSNLGRIRSENRTIVKRDGRITLLRGRPLKTTPGKVGYPVFNARGTTLCVHRCVLLAFVGPCPDGQEVRHKNGVRADVRLENLEYGTRAQNIDDAKRHGTFPVLEQRPGAKLTRGQAREIAASSEFADILAERYGIAYGTVQQIRNGRIWADITAGVRKGSYRPRGEASPVSRLSNEVVLAIFHGNEGCRKAARRFGVSKQTISDIRSGRTWKHITGGKVVSTNPPPAPGPQPMVGSAAYPAAVA